MKKTAYALMALVVIAILAKIFVDIPGYPEKVVDIFNHWLIAWLKGGLIAAIAIGIVFGINKQFDDERTMSIVGIIALGVVVPGMIYILFSSDWRLLLGGAIVGVTAGYFSYIIDDHLFEAWELRQATLPIIFGLGFGGSAIIAALIENWQDEHLYATQHAVCVEITVERYTHHSDGDNSYYSWDYHKSYYVIVPGEVFPEPVEDKDYELGRGALGTKDRAIFKQHKWVGGQKLSKTGEDLGFKWVYLGDIELKYERGKSYEIEENFFGWAIKDGKERNIPAPKQTPVSTTLPKESDVPGALSLTWNFFKIMAINPDFALLRWIYLLIYVPFVLGAILDPELRIPLLLFFIASTIVIFLILSGIALRRGTSLRDLIPEPRFRGFGGGSGGGGGAFSRW